MIEIIYKISTENFNANEIKLMPINKDYNFTFSAFGDLSKINIFIGENNSGKSRFLRSLFTTDFFGITEKQYEKIFEKTKSLVFKEYTEPTGSNIIDFNCIYEKLGGTRIFYFTGDRQGDFFTYLKDNSNVYDNNNKFYFPVTRGIKDYKSVINNKLKKFLTDAHSIQNKDSINHFISLLNLEQNGLENFDIYNEIVNHEYFENQKDSLTPLNIITGGKLYNEIKRMLLGTEEERKLIKEFQDFLKDNFFEDHNVVQLIPNESKKVLYVKIGKDERPIYNWGDGTQQLIIILFSLFIHKDEKNKLFFIEEPEMYFHPGILRKFIEVLNMEIFKNHQYFITTHSNVVLDTSADTNINMSIFKFKKVKNIEENKGKDFLIEQCNNGNVSLLNELGVRNSSVFLSNCSVWVEGITDRLYLKHFIRLYNEKYVDKVKYRENIDYTFIEYGGGNVVHFNFDENDNSDSINARYINNKIFLITDNDDVDPISAKALRKKQFKETLNENYYELPVIEIENLVSSEILKKVLIKQNKDKSDLINNKFEKEQTYKMKDLGEYIDNVFNDCGLKQYAAKSGTIKNKLKFCEDVIESTTDYDMLTSEAKDLTESVYKFIEKNNI